MRATWLDYQSRATAIWRCIRCGGEAPRAGTAAERRDPVRRAAAVTTVVRCLCGTHACSSEALCAALAEAPPAAADRIIRWLAAKGLAKNVGPGEWVATPPLRTPAPLEPEG